MNKNILWHLHRVSRIRIIPLLTSPLFFFTSRSSTTVAFHSEASLLLPTMRSTWFEVREWHMYASDARAGTSQVESLLFRRMQSHWRCGACITRAAITLSNPWQCRSNGPPLFPERAFTIASDVHYVSSGGIASAASAAIERQLW